MLQRMSGILENLVVYPERMLHNLQRPWTDLSQPVLLALPAKDVREEAYQIVQEHAMRAGNQAKIFSRPWRGPAHQ
jgi:adenylosuccinate lyase